MTEYILLLLFTVVSFYILFFFFFFFFFFLLGIQLNRHRTVVMLTCHHSLKMHRMTVQWEGGEDLSAHMHVSSPQLLNGLSLNLVIDYTKKYQADLILACIGINNLFSHARKQTNVIAMFQ
jgi:hypothetical protein